MAGCSVSSFRSVLEGYQRSYGFSIRDLLHRVGWLLNFVTGIPSDWLFRVKILDKILIIPFKICILNRPHYINLLVKGNGKGFCYNL